jgi:hypothetical protein
VAMSSSSSVERLRAAGAGRRHGLVFVDRVLVTLAHLRLDLTHAALAELFDVDRCTVTKAIGEIRPLLAARGFATSTGFRLRTLADVFAYAQAEGVRLGWAAPKSRSADPPPTGPEGAGSSQASGGRTPTSAPSLPTARAARCGSAPTGQAGCTIRPRSRPKALRTCSASSPKSNCPWTSGYQGLAKPDPKRIVVPPPKPGQAASADEITIYQRARRHQSSERICVEHAIAEIKPGESSSATTAGGSTWPRPSMPSCPWPPIGRPAADPPPHNPPGQHVPTSTANIVVRRVAPWHPATEPPQKPVGGSRRPLLVFRRPCERTRRWYP